ncbi:MAG: hypothetical protein ACQEQD_10800 [Bacillota bacterium]
MKSSNKTKTTKPKMYKLPTSQEIKPSEKRKKQKKNYFISEEEIEKIQENQKKNIKFSFECFKLDDERFNLGGIEKDWFINFLGELRSISKITKEDFFGRLVNYYDPHDHTWDKINANHFEKEFLKQIGKPMQFKLSNSKGRVHGFFNLHTFCIVWLDPHHNLYPDDRYGGETCFSFPQTPYEKLKKENIKLKKEIDEVKSCNEELLEEMEAMEEQMNE